MRSEEGKRLCNGEMMEGGRTKDDEQSHCFSVFDGEGFLFFVDIIVERGCVVVCVVALLRQESELHAVAFVFV